jgi:hypothetical protein
MASVSFRNIEKAFGKTKIIHGISFDIQDGEFGWAFGLWQIDAITYVGWFGGNHCR